MLRLSWKLRNLTGAATRDYPRRLDVAYQLEYARPDLRMRSSLIDAINDMVALLAK